MTKEVALVTGGTSGLGKAQVFRWVKEGYEVIFCGRNEEDGKAIESESGATFIKCDVTDPKSVENMFEQIKNKYDRFDVLYNKSGYADAPGRLHEIDVDKVKKMFDVNTLGAWNVMKYGLKLMVEYGNGGRIVNMSSLAGLCGITGKHNASHYGAAKAAIVNMTQSSAISYIPEKVRINAVAPTAIKTEFIEKFLATTADPDAAMKEIDKANPTSLHHGDMPTPDDVTGVVSFLVGPDSKFITGQTIAIDGGYTIQ